MAHGASCCTAGRRSAFGSGPMSPRLMVSGTLRVCGPCWLGCLTLRGVMWRSGTLLTAGFGDGFRDLAAMVEERAGDGLGLILLDLVTDLTRLESEAAA
jgi:hypothetical protein